MADIDKEYYLGIDIGGTKCAVVVGDGDFNFYREVQFETQKGERALLEVFMHATRNYSTRMWTEFYMKKPFPLHWKFAG